MWKIKAKSSGMVKFKDMKGDFYVFNKETLLGEEELNVYDRRRSKDKVVHKAWRKTLDTCCLREHNRKSKLENDIIKRRFGRPL